MRKHELPEDRGTPPFITFRSEVANAIGDARRAIMRGGDATWELEALRSTLFPWSKDDAEFEKRATELEGEMLRFQDRGRWPRPRKPWWQSRYYSLLIDLQAEYDRLLGQLTRMHRAKNFAIGVICDVRRLEMFIDFKQQIDRIFGDGSVAIVQK